MSVVTVIVKAHLSGDILFVFQLQLQLMKLFRYSYRYS